MNVAPLKRHRISTNALLSASTWLLPMLLSFVATPILLSSLGRDAYGLYALVLGFIGYSFTFGIGKSAAKYVAEFGAEGEEVLASEAVSASFWFSLAIGAFGAIVISISAGWFIDRVLQIREGMADEGKTALLIAAVIIFATMLSQVWSYVLQGLQRFDHYAIVTALGSVILNTGSIILALYNSGVKYILIWNLISTCILGLAYFAVATHTAPNIRLTLKIRDRVRNAVLRYGSAIILAQVFGNLLLLIERSWVTRTFGVDALTYYVVPMTLALFLHAFVGSIVIVLFPVVNEKLSKTDQVARIYRSSTKFVLAIVSFAFVASIVFGRSILSVWIGDEVAERAVVILPIHIATFGMLASATVAWHILESFGRARANAIFSLCWLLIGTSLMFAFGRSYGLEGIAIARFIGCVGVVPLAVFVERELLNSFSTSYWIVSLARLAAAAAAATAAQGIIIGILDGIVSVVIGIGVSGVAFAGVLFAVRYFDADELNWLRRSLRPADS